MNYVMPVSATSYNGAPINEDADAPAVAFSRLGQAEVAYRQPAGRGSPLPGPRIYLNVLSDGEAASGAQFAGASVADNTVARGKNASVGRPTLDVNERLGMRLLYDSNGTPRVIEGTGLGLSGQPRSARRSSAPRSRRRANSRLPARSGRKEAASRPGRARTVAACQGSPFARTTPEAASRPA